jgi:hypothetical protein
VKAVGEASKAYGLLKEGFSLTEEYPEFLFATGIYNYFREAYPEKYPIVKPFMWLFRSGDKELGINQIKRATEVAIVARIEAYMYITYIYLRYEEKPFLAQAYMKELLQKYPTNEYIQSKYLESLNVPGSYRDLPEEIIEGLMMSRRNYFKLVGYVFKGLQYEKHLGDTNAAFQFYNDAIGIGKELEGYADHYKSLAYLGAARILKTSNKERTSQTYYQMALEYAQTEEVSKEARSALDE